MTTEMKYWRSIENRERTENYVKSISDEFREGDSEISGVDRRNMLKLMGASLAFAGVGIACRRPSEKILPYTKAPEEIVPGIPNYFATARPSALGATGLVVESHEGRPTKVEGNAEHPVNRGTASIHDQASVLELYDPDRSRMVMKDQAPATWSEWETFSQAHFTEYANTRGEGLAFLLNGEDSPTATRLQKEILAKYSKAQFFAYDPLALTNTNAGAELAFGVGNRVLPNFENAKVILTLQADPFMWGAGALANARGFAVNRRVYNAADASKMNRLYSVEATFSVTGTNADHRLRLAASDSLDFLRLLASELGLAAFSSSKNIDAKFVKALAKDLAQNASRSLIVVGETQDASVHALAHVINHALKGLNQTYRVIKANNIDASSSSIAKLVKKLNEGEIRTLVCLDVNPVYASAGAIGFSKALAKANTIIHLGLYQDETAQLAHWHLPMSHFLESWGDTRAYDGTTSVIQPLIAPLHGGRSTIEILAQVLNIGVKKGHDLVKQTWAMDDKAWRKVVHDGVFSNSAFASSSSVPKMPSFKSEKTSSADNIELVFQYDYKVLDGRLANLGWLQELPDAITKSTWDNVLLVSPALAKQMGIKSRVADRTYRADVLSVKVAGNKIELPAFIVPGIADYSVIAFLGYGRKNAGTVGNDVGVDVYPILPVDDSKYVSGVKLARTGESVKIATTQEQFAMNGDAIQDIKTLSLQKRDPARENTVSGYQKDPGYIKKPSTEQMTDAWQYTGNKWGMVIDLTSCIGCNACVTACQSENNIPVVGKTQVMRSRSMHWIRVDRYFTGDVESPQSISQPVPCMHCENAPCEPVCPVAATVHDKEGLNTMAYNRCVGTRYCGNNCPYKVRRFNYLDFSHSGDMYVDPLDRERNILLQMQKNPDVTIRYRGVMEKCTYCTQRIQEAKMDARRKGEDVNAIKDGAVTPACAQTCPTQAITFGNLNDEDSRVSKLKLTDRHYDLLGELNTRPRTSYLAKLRNPNPELV